jgi:hypothetical protein
MHLSAKGALDFLEGRLDGEQEAFWKSHMEHCNDCKTEFQNWRQLGIDLKQSNLESAPAADIDRAVQLFQPAWDRKPSAIRSILAMVTFDSLLQPSLAGSRGSSAATRQLVMRAEEFDIHIKIFGAPDHRRLLGQVLPRDGSSLSAGARFHLLQHGERIDSTVTDDMGEFDFVDIPAGELSLQIDLPNLTVVGALNVPESNP